MIAEIIPDNFHLSFLRRQESSILKSLLDASLRWHDSADVNHALINAQELSKK